MIASAASGPTLAYWPTRVGLGDARLDLVRSLPQPHQLLGVYTLMAANRVWVDTVLARASAPFCPIPEGGWIRMGKDRTLVVGFSAAWVRARVEARLRIARNRVREPTIVLQSDVRAIVLLHLARSGVSIEDASGATTPTGD